MLDKFYFIYGKSSIYSKTIKVIASYEIKSVSSCWPAEVVSLNRKIGIPLDEHNPEV